MYIALLKCLIFNQDFVYITLCHTTSSNGTFDSTFFPIHKWFENHDPSAIPKGKCSHIVKF